MIEAEQIGMNYAAGDPHALVSAIRWLLAHEDERLRMGQRSLRLFESRYSADAIYSAAADHLEHIASRPRVRRETLLHA